MVDLVLERLDILEVIAAGCDRNCLGGILGNTFARPISIRLRRRMEGNCIGDTGIIPDAADHDGFGRRGVHPVSGLAVQLANTAPLAKENASKPTVKRLV